MRMTNSMNKARQRFEAWGKAQPEPAGIPAGEICLLTVMSGGKAETANSKPVSQQLHASKGTTLPGATIDGLPTVSRRQERTLLRDNGLAAVMPEGMPPNAPCLEPEKSGYNGRSWYSSRMAAKGKWTYFWLF